MKIIARDNRDRDYISDKLIAENLSQKDAETVLDALNKGASDSSDWFFEIVPDDHKLYKYSP
jgi:hypothetical protein